MPNRGCNLECVRQNKGDDDVLEFVGPVKIVLVDQPRNAYLRKIWYAAVIAMAQIMLAVTTMIVLFFSMSYKKKTFMKALHVLLCTVGLQSCLLSGILSLNNFSGASAPMKIADRKFEHVFIQSFGLVCAVLGTLASLFSGFSPLLTIHSYLGILADSVIVLSGASGLYIYEFCGEMLSTDNLGIIGKFIYIFHRIFGIVAVIVSLACFITGISKNTFKKWLPVNDIYTYMIIFCIFYTIVIVYKPVKKFLK